MDTFTIEPRGPFSLAEAANFGFGQRHDTRFDGVMRLAFCLDGYHRQVGVAVRQDGSGVHCRVDNAGDQLPAVQRQVARVLSLDHDGNAFAEVGRRDPVIGQLMAVAPGLRPPLFYSPYEAAAWAVISARRPARQMAEVRQKLSEAHGRSFELAGEKLAAFPLPEALLRVETFAGLPAEKIARLHAVARAARQGQLDVGRLAAMNPDAAMADLKSLRGIGPFYSALIVIRACGLADVLPTQEPQALELAAKLYGLSAPPGPAEFTALAEPWRPFRTWAVVLIRAAGARLLGESGGEGQSAGSRPTADAGESGRGGRRRAGAGGGAGRP